MFVMDVPPDVPPQYVPIVVAEAKQATQESMDRTLGVCHLVESRLESRESAVNSIGPVQAVWGYLHYGEKQPIDYSTMLSAKMTLLQAPKHGVLGISQAEGAYVVNVPNFEGADNATVLVEIGGYKVTVKYFFNIMTDVPGSGAEGSPYDDKSLCPKGRTWRISFDENNPDAPIYTLEHPYPWTTPLTETIRANLRKGDRLIFGVTLNLPQFNGHF